MCQVSPACANTVNNRANPAASLLTRPRATTLPLSSTTATS